MSNTFIGTNICVYAFDGSDFNKQSTAWEILKTKPAISSQVIIETYLACRKKLKFPTSVCDENLLFLLDICQFRLVTDSNFRKALLLREKYSFSFLDSVILASALELGCKVLYTEDMRHGQVVEKQLKIENPFL